MKTIGLIGGMSWESTATYYRALNELVRERLGGLHSAKILLHSFDFAEIEALQANGNWAGAGEAMVDAARRLERGDAECLVICTNTMHKLAPEVREAVDLPLLHIGDATADAILAAGVSRPLLLATRYTMEQDFYRGRLRERGIEARIPDVDGRTVVHDVIYDELCRGIVVDGSRRAWQSTIVRAHQNNAGAAGSEKNRVPRTLPRRNEHEDSRHVRRAGQPRGLSPDRRTGARSARRGRVDGDDRRGRRAACRPGLRCGQAGTGAAGREGDGGGDPEQAQAPGATRARPSPVQGASPDRELLRPDQAVRTIATRYDKTAVIFLGAIHLVVAIDWLN